MRQTRTSADVCDTTASPPNADMPGSPNDIAEGPIALQKSFEHLAEKLDSRSSANTQQRFKRTGAPIRLFQNFKFTEPARRLLQQNVPTAVICTPSASMHG